MVIPLLELVIVARPSIDEHIKNIEKDIFDLKEYPIEKLCEIIREVGFECDLCTKCCTSEFNDHIFLLDQDLSRIRKLSADTVRPAPYFEFCDNNGIFYVSGYALQTKTDGSCIFLENGKCKVYEDRPLICRLYPYMLHREEDEFGKFDWRQISGLNEHGFYHAEITDEECKRIAALTKEYEIAYLTHKKYFLETIRKHFNEHRLKHVQSTYDRMIRKLNKGEKVKVMVFTNGKFEEQLFENTLHVLYKHQI